MSLRTLVDRWYFGNPSPREGWERSREYLWRVFRNLERVLNVLHGAVEYPAAPLAGIAFEPTSGTDTTINSTTPTAIAGASFTLTPEVDMSLLVTGSFSIQCNLFGAVNQYFEGYLSVNGAVLTSDQFANCSCSALNDRRQASQSWILPVVSGTQYTVELAAKTTNVATTFLALRGNTTISWLQLPNAYQVPG
jgi:hypothetical protein